MGRRTGQAASATTPAARRGYPRPQGPRLLVSDFDSRSPASRRVARLARLCGDEYEELIVKGEGSTMTSDWNQEFRLQVDALRRVWVLKLFDFGSSDASRTVPRVRSVAVLVDPDTADRDAIVQRLLDAAGEWFNLDLLDEVGDFRVRFPGFKDVSKPG